MATKTNNEQRYAGFLSLVEAVAAELYSQDEWKQASEDDKGLQLDHYNMLSEVYTTAFERDPSVFKGIQWINSEYGMPAWVRPGVEWTP